MNVIRKRCVWLVVVLVVLLVSDNVTGQSGRDWTVVGSDRMDVVVLEGDAVRFKLRNMVWGPGWNKGGARLQNLPEVAEGDVRVYHEKGIGFRRNFWDKEPMPGLFDLRYELRRAGPRTVRMRYACVPEMDTKFGVPAPMGQESVSIGPMLRIPPYLRGGTCTFAFADGSKTVRSLPVGRSGWDDVASLILETSDGESIRMVFEPALFVHCDEGEVRCFSGNNRTVKAGQTFTQEIMLQLPGTVSFEPGNRWLDTGDWMRYEHEQDFSPGSVIGVEDWLDKPAGKHGWLRMDGGRFVFEDGTPVKFVGTNIQFDDMACPEEDADRWNSKWAKHGVNLVRLHKFINHGWAGVLSEDHMVPDPEKIRLFDYYHASAGKCGIYTSWSGVFHMKVTSHDRDRVKYYDELVSRPGFNPRAGADVLGLKNIAPDIQNLLIAQTVNLLKRENTATGIRYADDPALAYIELHNEDDIFFPFDNYGRFEKNYPKYFADFKKRFCAYLKEKYGDQQALEQAWGESYPGGQSLADGTVRPHYPAWEMKQGQMTSRIADTLHFMYTEQLGFYRRFVEAIRDTGYGGAIVGGCWQASTFMGHLYNTLTDYRVGFIDRHNYNVTLLDDPGSGNMTVGFQQVKDRPFNFSEWGGGPVAVPTVLTYGLGLQGWDASCQFCSTNPGIFGEVHRAVNGCCDDFIQIGQYPALSRMIHRGDVKEGDIVANRRVSIPGLFKGDVGFRETFSMLGGANNKTFSSVVPNAALMAGRVVLEFIDKPVPEEPISEDFEQYIDRENNIVRSTTHELLWDHSGRGFFTVNTPGTQAVIGHAGGRTIALDDVTIRGATETELKLYVTALEQGATIKDAGRLLITAFGRDANTGMVMDEFSERPLEKGGPPLLLEPVRATITIKGGGVKAVRPLDHAGRLRKEGGSLDVRQTGSGNVFTIDGSIGKAVYYVVEMDR